MSGVFSVLSSISNTVNSVPPNKSIYLLKIFRWIQAFTCVETGYLNADSKLLLCAKLLRNLPAMQIYSSSNHRKKVKAKPSRLIPRKLTADLEFLVVL